MKKITAYIVDDEAQGRAAIRTVIEKHCQAIELLGEASGVHTAIGQVNELRPDILLLDIHLGDGTGFDVLRNLEVMPKTIFISAHDNFAIKAFKVNAIDYILKPFEAAELAGSVNRLAGELQQKKAVTLPEQTLVAMGGNKPERIVLPTSDGFEIINLSEISYLESDNNYTLFHVSGSGKKLVSKTLKYFEDILDENGFFRCHQKYMVNLSHIKQYHKGEGGMLVLHDQTSIDVSRRKKDELMERMSRNFLR